MFYFYFSIPARKQCEQGSEFHTEVNSSELSAGLQITRLRPPSPSLTSNPKGAKGRNPIQEMPVFQRKLDCQIASIQK